MITDDVLKQIFVVPIWVFKFCQDIRGSIDIQHEICIVGTYYLTSDVKLNLFSFSIIVFISFISLYDMLLSIKY